MPLQAALPGSGTFLVANLLITYLLEANRILKAQLGGRRLRLTTPHAVPHSPGSASHPHPEAVHALASGILARPGEALPRGHRQAAGGAATALVIVVHLADPQNHIALHGQVAYLRLGVDALQVTS